MWRTRFGRCIYTSASGYKVHQNLLYRWLTLGSDALQTVLYRPNPQKPVLFYLASLSLMARNTPDTCCLLGLGGAGIAHLLNAKQKICTITAVDSSDEVIELAQRFFMIEQIPSLTLVHQNALDYLKETRLSFTHLIVDLYDANNFPAECASDEFFHMCKQALATDGFISINLANIKEQWNIMKLVKKQFKNTVVLPIRKSANMVVIASNHQSRDLFINILSATREIKHLKLVERWGMVGTLR